MATRDPLSVHYDAFVRATILRGIAAARNRKSVQVWVASPRAEFARPDAGGRTAHERAFSRSVYYLVWREPVNRGVDPEWSVKLEWGDDGELHSSGAGKLARPVKIRVWPRSEARVRGPRWTDSPARQSRIGDDGERHIPEL